jgi:hypothetical protein
MADSGPAFTFAGPVQPLPVRMINLAARVFGADGSAPGKLRVDWLLRRVRRSTKLENFGDDPRPALEVLVEALNRERLTACGRLVARLSMLKVLDTRLRIEEARRRHPEIDELPIRRPVFIVGLPRTGTTLLYNLLACAPRARPLLTWEAGEPVPSGMYLRYVDVVRAEPGKRTGWADKQRRLRSRIGVPGVHRLVPGLDAVHPVRWDGPEEDSLLLTRSLTTWAYLFLAELRDYDDWLWRLPGEMWDQAYRLHRHQLRLLEWQRPSATGTYWVLKSPVHAPTVDAVLRTYPDACIVHTHRHLRSCLPSLCSLLGVARAPLARRLDSHEIGRRSLETWRRTFERMKQLRDRLPQDRVLDLNYGQIVGDPLGTVERIHRAFDLDFGADQQSRLREWLDRDRRRPRVRHVYSAGQFGLREAEIDELSLGYHERFGVEPDPPAAGVAA